MTTRSSALRKSTTQRKSTATKSRVAKSKIATKAGSKIATKAGSKIATKTGSRIGSKTGKLPEWNLSDLYSGIDAPEVVGDLQKMDADCVAFETDYKGKLAEHVARDDGGQWLAEAVKRYEAIDDLAGRLGSYAGLVHAGDSVDPKISKFYGDVSERLTAASVHLLFFGLELNRVDDVVIERALQTPALAYYRSRIASSNCFTKNPRAAMPPGTGCSTRPSQAFASRSAARSWRSSRR
jgi:oligoendopeptidase F